MVGPYIISYMREGGDGVFFKVLNQGSNSNAASDSDDDDDDEVSSGGQHWAAARAAAGAFRKPGRDR